MAQALFQRRFWSEIFRHEESVCTLQWSTISPKSQPLGQYAIWQPWCTERFYSWVSSLNASSPVCRSDVLHGMTRGQIDSGHLNTESWEEQKKKEAEQYSSVAAMLTEPDSGVAASSAACPSVAGSAGHRAATQKSLAVRALGEHLSSVCKLSRWAHKPATCLVRKMSTKTKCWFHTCHIANFVMYFGKESEYRTLLPCIKVDFAPVFQGQLNETVADVYGGFPHFPGLFPWT